MQFGLIRFKEMALERNPGLRRLPSNLLDRHCYQAFDQLEQYLIKQGDADQATAIAQRQCRLRQLCAESL